MKKKARLWKREKAENAKEEEDTIATVNLRIKNLINLRAQLKQQQRSINRTQLKTMNIIKLLLLLLQSDQSPPASSTRSLSLTLSPSNMNFFSYFWLIVLLMGRCEPGYLGVTSGCSMKSYTLARNFFLLIFCYYSLYHNTFYYWVLFIGGFCYLGVNCYNFISS